MKSYVKEMRVKSWIKNVFVFVPLVFALELRNAEKLLATLIAFAAFCLVSSAIYVFNDICDADKDATHPIKRARPIASGAISKRSAAVFAALLAIAGIAVGASVGVSAVVLIAAYTMLNLLYSLWLKHIPVLDCFCVATGFVLRVYTGGAASGEHISDWLFLTVAAASLFMAFGKRRGELLKVGDTATRKVLRLYDAVFLNGMVFVCAGLSIVFYALWAMYRGSNMIYTVPIILFLVSKYLLLIHNSDSHGDPMTVVFEDKILLLSCAAYALLVILFLYVV